MRKSIATSLIAGSMFVLMGQAFAAGFSDTTGTDYNTAFLALEAKGVIGGYADGLARPASAITRAEALKIMIQANTDLAPRLAWYRKHMPPIALYSDIDQKEWYAPYVEVAFEKGIVVGYPDATFRPGQYVRVEEAVSMLTRGYGVTPSNTTNAELSDYIENKAGTWFTSALNAAIEKNLVMHKGRLRIGTAITRGQFVDMVYRMDSVKTAGKVAYDGAEPQTAVVSVQPATPAPAYAAPKPSVSHANQPTGVSVNDGTVSAGVRQSHGTASSVSAAADPKKIANTPYASEKYFAISIPTLGISDLSVNHPQDPVSQEGVLAPLKFGVGHLFSYPGVGGKIMIYGHSSGYPWDVSQFTKIFRKVNELHEGDKVYVTYAGSLHVYQVTQKEAIPTKNTGDAFRDDGSGEELILFTCWPPDSITQRYLVHAAPVQTIALR